MRRDEGCDVLAKVEHTIVDDILQHSTFLVKTVSEVLMGGSTWSERAP
jgi:hypothetical protein